MKQKIRFEKNIKDGILTILESSEVDPGVVMLLHEEEYDLEEMIRASKEGVEPFLSLLRRRSFFPARDMAVKLFDGSAAFFKDEAEEIRKALDEVNNANAIFLTGGTGLTRRDITWQVVDAYCDESLPAFAVLFAQLSYKQVGSAAVLSRATAGIKRNRSQLIVALPGSSKACALAVDDILIPELAHIVGHLNK